MTETVVNVESAPNNNSANKPSGDNQALSWLRINFEYFRTTPGLVKIAQIVSDSLVPFNIRNTHASFFRA